MHKLFVGNLPPTTTPSSLAKAFQRLQVDVISVAIRKGGYAFVDVADQNAADRAIELFKTIDTFGVPIRVEPSMPRQQRNNRSNKVLVRQLPPDVDWSDFEKLIAQHGEDAHCDHTGSSENPSAIITFKTAEEANNAVEKLNNSEYKGQTLRATMYVERNRNVRRGSRPSGDDGYGGGGGGGMRPSAADMPLRMVVSARCVGAIIGQGGANIRQITKDSKARCVVDVSRGIRDPTGNVEKVINIYGTPENSSKACAKILEVVHREMQKDPINQGKTVEPELKLRAHNNLVGRLIGKGGGTIKKIMEETNCTIFVSNLHQNLASDISSHDYSPSSNGALDSPMLTDNFFNRSISELNAFNMERTITVRGTLENISEAEQKISGKLRQCWENDMVNAPHTMYGGVHPLMTVPPLGPESYGAYSPVGVMHPGSFIPGAGGAPSGHSGGQTPTAAATSLAAAPAPTSPQLHGPAEVVHIWVPNNIVGALIGTKGVHIRNVMRLTGAHIRIETVKPEGGQQQGGGDRRQQTEAERRVTITGTDQQQYKAQFWIFQRVCEQGYHFFDEVRLCTEIQVPSKMVGRIIGKGGQNVRELQRVTGAQVKIPEDAATETAEDTVVRIIGNFNAAQAVQARVRQLIHQFYTQQTRGNSGDNGRGRTTSNHNEVQE